MKRLKNLLFLALVVASCFVALSVQAQSNVDIQEDVLTFNDTTATFTIPYNATKVMITLVDSTISGTDTVYAYVGTYSSFGTRYAAVAPHDLNGTAQTTNVSPMIPGNGNTRSYLIDYGIPIQSVYLIRSNESTDDKYQPKTRIVISSFY